MNINRRVRQLAVYALVLVPYAAVMFYAYQDRPDLSYWVIVIGVILIELIIYNERYGEEPLYTTTQ